MENVFPIYVKNGIQYFKAISPTHYLRVARWYGGRNTEIEMENNKYITQRFLTEGEEINEDAFEGYYTLALIDLNKALIGDR